MITLTAQGLKAVMPNCIDPAGWCIALQPAMDRFGISVNKERMLRFLAQIAVESQELNRVTENLNYSAERLQEMWPKRFPNPAIAAKYARNPHGLANYVYSNRGGNGPPESNHGWTYRGRGPKQITFLDNYTWLGKELGLPLVQCPDQLCTKTAGCLAAALFWSENGLNELADDLPDDDQDSDFVTITRRITGGKTGLTARQTYLRRAEQHIV